MARRSSARIRNRNSSTPKRVSLSHDAQTRTPRTAPVKLQAVREYEDMPGAFPGSASPPAMDVNKHATTVPVKFGTSTPKNTTPIKPTEAEMHPQQHQQSTAKPLEEARWLGFSNMVPKTEPPPQTSKIAILQGTPTKAAKMRPDFDSPKFQFTFAREQSLELSPEAKKFMDEKREEALRIREQMIANGEATRERTEVESRKFATPKGKKGRFSGVHSEQFKKMDSIAGHASAFRAEANRSKATNNASGRPTETPQAQPVQQEAPRSLKRKTSQAGLDDLQAAQRKDDHNSSAKSSAQATRALPHLPFSKNPAAQASPDSASPAKRVKQTATDDASAGRSVPSDSRAPQISTPRSTTIVTKLQSHAESSSFTSPTQASVARASSIKSAKPTKIPAPGLLRTPSKVAVAEQVQGTPKVPTPLLARTPSKVSIFSRPIEKEPKGLMSPLLLRTPVKASSATQPTEGGNIEEPKPKKTPLLSRSPFKMSIAKVTTSEVADQKVESSIPFLARSPAKIALANNESALQPEQTPKEVNATSKLLGRFNLLRATPKKSILRSPQRLYSDDPAKVAAGTHFASPLNVAVSNDKPLPASPKTAHKRVEFSSSTKARYERAQSESSNSPSSNSPIRPTAAVESTTNTSTATYPALPVDNHGSFSTPQKRRQTAAPGDFTFTSHGHGIIFAQSPNAPASAVNSNIPSTIRHVSAEPALPATGSKKRKFDFENDQAVDEEMVGQASDKENVAEDEAERPAKRVKTIGSTAPPPPPAAKTVTRPPTIGVKPKKSAKDGKEKKPTTISRARLNALAQPKRKA